ncbi:hypothetical protein BD779DRAFT_1510830 [Infundibulicybe gibba]|nr:hypothetical protein BD779DRAFT_1510830 [Infundibulicybe gibba]
MDRPVTSKPRGICCYYKTERGCFAKDKCKFLHGDPDREPGPLLTPYDKAKTCRYYAAGFCTRGNKCWFLHVSPDPAARRSCSICFEKPPTYGLLSNCSHVFCIDCIRQWRDPKGKTGDVKCPMCRIPSKYIIPSARFYPEGTEEKLLIEKKYRESTAKIKCRYFEQSKRDSSSPVLCPFGKDCFYKHINSDGTPHIFSDGVDVSMRVSVFQVDILHFELYHT